jgi:hypothetical protein
MEAWKQNIVDIYKTFIEMYEWNPEKAGENFRQVKLRMERVITAFENNEEINEKELWEISSQINALNKMDINLN